MKIIIKNDNTFMDIKGSDVRGKISKSSTVFQMIVIHDCRHTPCNTCTVHVILLLCSNNTQKYKIYKYTYMYMYLTCICSALIVHCLASSSVCVTVSAKGIITGISRVLVNIDSKKVIGRGGLGKRNNREK